MVLASFFVFVAYGKSKSLSLRTKNRRQRNRAIWFWSTTGIIFSALLVADYVLDLYNPTLASAIRQASQGIGWIFQFGMGVYLLPPFCGVCRGIALLVLHRCQVADDRATGRLWDWSDVHRRVCVACSRILH